MHRSIIATILCALAAPLASFADEPRGGPVIHDYGQVYAVPDPAVAGSPRKGLRAVFDVSLGADDPREVNVKLETVARYLNMHAQAGYPQDRTLATLVIHGTATRDVLTDEAYHKRFASDNPNRDLLEQLRDAGVEIYVCGQSIAVRGFKREEVAPSIEVSLSAMTVLIHRQSKGYALIAF